MDDDERGGLVGLLLGLGLGALATWGHGGMGLGVVAALLVIGSIAWLSTSYV